jgi:hypothetical protein
VTPPNRVKLWGEDGKTAVEVPTYRSQQRLKAIADPGHGWDEDVHTTARPADAILPPAAFRNSQVPAAAPEPPPLPDRIAALEPPPLPEVIAIPELPPFAGAPSFPSSFTSALPTAPAPSFQSKVASPRPASVSRANGALRPRHWVLAALTAVAFSVAGYAVVRVAQVLSQRSALRAGAVFEPEMRALDSGWPSIVADGVEPLLARLPSSLRPASESVPPAAPPSPGEALGAAPQPR